MHESPAPVAASERFAWLERPGDDFPYYRGRPVAISAAGWWVVMVGVVAGFAVFVYPPPFLRGQFSGFVPTILYAVIPLAALAFVAGRAWTAIFRPLRGRDFLLMAGFAVLNIAVTLVVGAIMVNLMQTTANEVVADAGALQGAGLWLFFARTAVQLLGEEVMSIVPFLAVLAWLTGRGMGRRAAVVVATLAAVVIFAAAHLPTYGWNVAQALMGVGVARIVLLLPYIVTKNIWVSTGAHILNDWAIFTVSILGAAGVAGDGG